MLNSPIRSVLVGAALCSVIGSAFAVTLRVPQNFPTIQAAIDAAPPGATVLVAPGTYRENLFITKSITLRSVAGARTTIIDGQRAGPVVVARGTASEIVVISGFTVTNGLNNNSLSSSAAPSRAGGIHMESVAGTITDNVIRDNVGCVGAGISAVAAAMIIQRNQILNNPQDPECDGADGGGIFLVGDGARGSLVANNIVSGHRTSGRGAGLAIQNMTDVTVRENLFNGNDANSPGGGAGGGILINVASATINGNVFVGNSAQSGGAMALFPIDNANVVKAQGNVMANNQATLAGSAIYLITASDQSLRLTGSIVDGATATALIRCDTPFTVPANNLLHNAQGPELDGACTSP
jgi:hypothetical protein